jgi:hypothetical protein
MEAEPQSKYKLKCFEGPVDRIHVSDHFIKTNNLTFNRTPEEIVEKIKADDSMFNFCADVLIDYLRWGDAKEHYKQEFVTEVGEGKAKPPTPITDQKEAVQDMLDYLVFGWGKALDERGISASRTVYKLAAWFWLLGREDLEREVKLESRYNPYGMPALIYVSEQLGIPVPETCKEFASKPCPEEAQLEPTETVID